MCRMQVFKSEFPLAESQTIDLFTVVVEDWIKCSPHTKLHSDDIAKILKQDEGQIKSETEVVEWVKVILKKSQHASILYVKTELGLEWQTTVTYYHQDGEQVWIGVQISCTTIQNGTAIPNAKKPIIVNNLLRVLEGGKDGEIFISHEPYYLKSSDVDFASRCINGHTNSNLPFVYVSALPRNSRFKHAIKPQMASRAMSGLAHILVEPDRNFSSSLMKAVNYENPYGGDIAIFWPNTQKTIKVEFSSKNSAQTILQITSLILEENLKKRPRLGCTWSFVSELNAKKKIEELRKSESSQIEDYIRHFDQENTALKQQKNEAESELHQLKLELIQLRSQTRRNNDGNISIKSSYTEAYPNEIETVIIQALEKSIDYTYTPSRRYDIIKDIIDCNHQSPKNDELKKSIKNALKGYKSITKSIRDLFEEIGLEIKSDEGKHLKFEYKHDKKFSFTIAKSASDYRAGDNLTSDINKTIF